MSVSMFGPDYRVPHVIFRGTIVNRTYGSDKKLYISRFLLNLCGPIYYSPHVIERSPPADLHDMHHARVGSVGHRSFSGSCFLAGVG